MRDKRKRILSLALILAMVVQLISGLGNVAKAASATEIAITGLGGSYKSISEGATEEQIGFLMAGASIASEYQWKKNATVLNNFLLNSEEQRNSDGWYIRLTASNGFALAKNQAAPYIPAEGDVITFPQGMQIQINGTDIVYEITEDFTIKYDGVKWAKYTEGTPLTISGRNTGNDATSGTTTQIGFNTGETIALFESDWLNCTITSGSVTLNDAAQGKWYIRIVGKQIIRLACPDYTPVANDIIKIPAGTQFTYSTTGDVYEITEDYTIQYDGTTWSEYTEATSLTISGRYTGTDSAAGANTTQIGLSTNETIDIYVSDWLNCTMPSASVTLNDVAQSTWYIRITGKNNLNLACPNYTPTKNDIIKIPAGTQFVYGTSVYEIAEDYTIQHDGTTWSEYTGVTMLTISGRYTGTDSAAGASTTQIGLSTNETIDIYVSDWLNCTMPSAGVTLNDVAQSTWYIRITGKNNLNLACPNYTPTKNDIIKIPAGTQFVYGTSVYEIAEDYTIQYDGTTWSEYTGVTTLTISGRYKGTDSAAGASTTQIGLSTSETINIYESNWLNCTITLGNVTLNDAAQSTWYIRIAGKKNLNLACPEYIPATNDIIKIPAGTQFTYETSVYEIAEDYTIQYDGTTWAEYTEATSATDITITGRNEGTDSSNASVVQIGLQTGETIAIYESDWLNCTISLGNIMLNDVAQSGWYIRIVGKNNLNLACTNYTPVAKDTIKIPAGTQFAYGKTVYEIAEDYAIKYTGKTWIKDVEITTLTIVGRFKGTDSTSGTTTQIGFQTSETIDIYEKDWLTCKVVSEGIKLNGVVQSGWYMRIVGTNNLNLACPEYTPAANDAISIPAGTQFIYGTNVYEIKEAMNLIYHNGEWVLDDTIITYRGEKLVEGNLYGFRIGNTKQAIEALFKATDGIGRNLEITFEYPEGMFDAENIFQTGTYNIKVSASNYSGYTAEYNIIAKGFTKDAPTISYNGETELLADAGKKFDVSSLNATAKDGNGKKLDIQYKYSDGALNSAGELNKGIHTLYLVATDDEGQPVTKSITLKCYEMTDIVIKGFYVQFGNQLFVATNMKEPERFKISGIIPTDGILVNGKSDVITWITVDEHSGSLYMKIEPKKGDVLTIEGGTTFLDHKNYIGLRTLNSFKGHTDGIGWIKDRLPNNGFGTTASSNSSASPTSPATGDTTPWIGYLGVCILLIPVIVVLFRRKSKWQV